MIHLTVNYYYQLCCDHIGQDVEITDHHGKTYVGRLEKVDRENVYLRQAPPPRDYGHGGPGVFFFPLAVGALIAIPLIGIAGFRRRRF